MGADSSGTGRSLSCGPPHPEELLLELLQPLELDELLELGELLLEELLGLLELEELLELGDELLELDKLLELDELLGLEELLLELGELLELLELPLELLELLELGELLLELDEGLLELDELDEELLDDELLDGAELDEDELGGGAELEDEELAGGAGLDEEELVGGLLDEVPPPPLPPPPELVGQPLELLEPEDELLDEEDSAGGKLEDELEELNDIALTPFRRVWCGGRETAPQLGLHFPRVWRSDDRPPTQFPHNVLSRWRLTVRRIMRPVPRGRSVHRGGLNFRRQSLGRAMRR